MALLMIVDDVDVVCVAVLPNKADAVLLVDADAVLSLTLPFEGLQLQTRSAQVAKVASLIQKQQTTSSDAFERLKPVKCTTYGILRQAYRRPPPSAPRLAHE
jgi:hypothetical protein